MNQRGFSLLEVLIGLVVLAFGLLAMAGMQITSIQGNRFGNDLTQATILGQNKLEELKNLPYTKLKSQSPQSAQQIRNPLSGIEYTVLCEVIDTGNWMSDANKTWKYDPGRWMQLMTATVRWTDRGDHQVTLSTIKSR